jgi:hypothetical protein
MGPPPGDDRRVQSYALPGILKVKFDWVIALRGGRDSARAALAVPRRGTLRSIDYSVRKAESTGAVYAIPKSGVSTATPG